jgi:uncharacterized protein (TIGR04255 family)
MLLLAPNSRQCTVRLSKCAVRCATIQFWSELCSRLCIVDFDFVKRQPVLENPPLQLVLAQMRFPHQIGLAEADVKPIQRALADIYPIPELGKVAEFSLGPAGASATGELESVFQFRSEKKDWTVTVTRSSISLETSAYLDFTDFIKRWYAAVSVVVEALGISRQERIGLRYVDELECPPRPSRSDLAEIVRDELIGIVGAHERTQHLVGSMQEMRFEQSQGVCTLRHGLIRRDRAVYVLDFDFYDETPRDLDLEQQVKLLAEFNHSAYELFSWSVSPKLFETFKPQEVANA